MCRGADLTVGRARCAPVCLSYPHCSARRERLRSSRLVDAKRQFGELGGLLTVLDVHVSKTGLEKG